MKTHLENYVKIYPMLDKEFCDNIVKNLKSEHFNRHSFRTYNDDLEHSDIDPKYASADHQMNVETYNIIMDKYYEVLGKYVKDLDFSWFSRWNGYSPPKFNLYEEGTAMKNHCDHIHSLFDGSPRGIPTLSMITTLHNDCEGGEFMMFENKEYKIAVGEVIIFPSIFLFPHEVKTVTKGKRISMVSWTY